MGNQEVSHVSSSAERILTDFLVTQVTPEIWGHINFCRQGDCELFNRFILQGSNSTQIGMIFYELFQNCYSKDPDNIRIYATLSINKETNDCTLRVTDNTTYKPKDELIELVKILNQIKPIKDFTVLRRSCGGKGIEHIKLLLQNYQGKLFYSAENEQVVAEVSWSMSQDVNTGV